MPPFRRVVGKLRYKCAQRRLLREEAARREHSRLSGRLAGTIACQPEQPSPHSVLRPIAATLGLEITHDLDGAAAVFFWPPDCSTVREPTAELVAFARERRVLNIASHDISKSTVSRVFEEAFGYQLGVDPRQHTGEVLEKPEKNATHTGRRVTCPMKPRAGYSYQLLIDNQSPAGMVEDIRTPVYGGSVPLAYLKFRPLSERFSNTNTFARLVGSQSVLSRDEQENIGAMANLMGVDYCEMDCLRDRRTGRLYVVDVNTSPWGPPNHLRRGEAERAIGLLASAFEAQFLSAGADRLKTAPFRT